MFFEKNFNFYKLRVHNLPDKRKNTDFIPSFFYKKFHPHRDHHNAAQLPQAPMNLRRTNDCPGSGDPSRGNLSFFGKEPAGALLCPCQRHPDTGGLY